MAVTLQQIAEACGVSRGTVDRALHGKTGIRPEVAQRVRETAQKMGYLSRRASPVVSKRTVRIGVVLHSGYSEFVQLLAGYFRAAPARELLPVEVLVRLMDGVNVSHQLALIDELVKMEHVDGLALMPLAHGSIRDKVNELTGRGIPVVTFNTDIDETGRLAYVGPDDIAAGRAAAGLMALAMQETGTVLPIVGQEKGHYADTQRRIGFCEEMAQRFPQIDVLPELCNYLDQDLAERIVTRVLQEHPDLRGVYVSSAGHQGVYRAIERAGVAGSVHVVVHDLTANNLHMIRRGVVDFAVGQDAKVQGTLPLHLLYQYLTKHVEPERRSYTTEISIKFRYNLEGLDEYVP